MVGTVDALSPAVGSELPAEGEPRAPRATPVHLATLAATLAFWSYLDRRLWFFGDEWDFLTRRGFHGATFSAWAPHNEHWSVLPIVLWRGTFSLWHLSSYWPYLIPVLLAHLGVVHLLWRRLRREGASPVVADAFAFLMGFFGTGAENLSWAFQIGFVGSVLFGLLAVEAADRLLPGPTSPGMGAAGTWAPGGAGGRARAARVVVFSLCSLMCSGVGVAMTAAVGAVLLRRRGWRGTVQVLALPGASYLVWFVMAGRRGLSATGDSFGLGTFTSSPVFVARNLADGLGRGWGLPVLGPVLLATVLVFAVVSARRLWADHPVPLALAVGALCFYFMAALGRDRLSMTQYPSRYAYIGFALLIPLMVLAIGRLPAAAQSVREWRWARSVAVGRPAPAPFVHLGTTATGASPGGRLARLVVTGAVLAATGTNIAAARHFTSTRTVFVRALGDQIVTSAWLLRSPEQWRRAVNRYPVWASGAASGYLTPGELLALSYQHLLPVPLAAQMRASTVLIDESWLDVVPTASPLYAGRFRLHSAAGAVSERPAAHGGGGRFPPMVGGCRTFGAGGGGGSRNAAGGAGTAQVVLTGSRGAPGSVQVALAQAGRLRARLVRAWGTRSARVGTVHGPRPSKSTGSLQVEPGKAHAPRRAGVLFGFGASWYPSPWAGSSLGEIVVLHPGEAKWLDVSVPGDGLVLALDPGQSLRVCGLAR